MVSSRLIAEREGEFQPSIRSDETHGYPLVPDERTS